MKQIKSVLRNILEVDKRREQLNMCLFIGPYMEETYYRRFIAGSTHVS